MKIPIRYNPLGNDYDTSGGAVYGSKGCFLFRNNSCVQSKMTIDGMRLMSGTNQLNRMEVYASGQCSDTVLVGGALYVRGGVAQNVEVLARGNLQVSSGGTADGVSILATVSSAGVIASSGGVMANITLGVQSAKVSCYYGTLTSISSVPRTYIYNTSGYVDGAVIDQSSYIANQGGTVANVVFSHSLASGINSSGYMTDVAISQGSVFFQNGSASNIYIGDGAIVQISSGYSLKNATFGAKASLLCNFNDGFPYEIQGTCPYGTVLASDGNVDGGIYHSISCNSNVNFSNIHAYPQGSYFIYNKCYVDGFHVHGSGTGSDSRFRISAYTTMCNMVFHDDGARMSAHVLAMSTLSNVRFSNAGTSGTQANSFTILGDGTCCDISAGANAYVSANISYGGLLESASLGRGNLTANNYGVFRNIVVDSGAIFIEAGGTATNVGLGSGDIRVTSAITSDLRVSNGNLMYWGCNISGSVVAYGTNCYAYFSNYCQLSSVSFASWRTANLQSATAVSVGFGTGSYNVSNGNITSVEVSEGATVKFSEGSHGMITVSSGGVFEANEFADVSTVHVLSGGSLNCVSSAHVWACTSEAGAIVTGSNIEIL